MIQNNLVSLPRLQYVSEYQNNYQYQNAFKEENHEQNNTFNRDGKKIFLPGKLSQICINFTKKIIYTGRDYYDQSLTMHESVLNNLERTAQLESNDVQDHINDIDEPEHETHYHNNLEDSLYFDPRERSYSHGSQNRFYLSKLNEN